MQSLTTVPRAVRAVAVAVLALAASVPPAAGQTAGDAEAPADRETVLVLDFQVLDQSAKPDGGEELSRVAGSAARMFRGRMEEDGRFTLVPAQRFREARTRLAAEGAGCADATCAREAARSLGVDQVFRGRVIKVSNLIWYLIVEHEDVASGQVLGRETIELKGQRDAILPRAVAALHRWLLPAG